MTPRDARRPPTSPRPSPRAPRHGQVFDLPPVASPEDGQRPATPEDGQPVTTR